MHSNIFIFVFILNLYGSDICQYIYIYIYRGRRGRGDIIVEFMTTCAISAYHHTQL